MPTREQIRIFFLKLTRPVNASANMLNWSVGLIGVVMTYHAYFVDDKSTEHLILAGALALIAVGSVLFVAVREFIFYRKYKIAYAIKRLKIVSEDINSLNVFLRAAIDRSMDIKDSHARARAILTNVVNEYAQIFSILTGEPCRACIKAVYKKADMWYVYALAPGSRQGLKTVLPEIRSNPPQS